MFLKFLLIYGCNWIEKYYVDKNKKVIVKSDENIFFGIWHIGIVDISSVIFHT